MKRLKIQSIGIGGLGCALLLSGWLQAEILTFYSDKGLLPGFTGVPVYSGCGFPTNNAIAEGQNQGLTVVPEGFASWKIYDTSPLDCYFGWGVTYPAMDLTRFNSGELRFWINSAIQEIKLEIKDSGGNVVLKKEPIGLTPGQLNTWVPFRVPFSGSLSGSGLSSVANPILFTALQSQATFYIDHVRYVDSTASPIFQTTLKNISNNSPAAEITWNAATLPAGWMRADQYIQVDVDTDALAWGVQIYTDNRASDATPPYTGLISSFTATPAGLVDTTVTSKKLPLAWATRSNVSTITVVAADPNNRSDPNSFQWMMMEDASQVAVPDLKAAKFENGDPFITAYSNQGIHFAQDPSEFGAENSPMRIYLEADFSTAVTPRTYRTTALRLEFYYL